MDELHDELGDDGFDGQTSRVVDVFALVFAAGCLTIEYGITPWSKQRLLEAVKIVFADYDRRRRGDAEQLDAEQVLATTSSGTATTFWTSIKIELFPTGGHWQRHPVSHTELPTVSAGNAPCQSNSPQYLLGLFKYQMRFGNFDRPEFSWSMAKMSQASSCGQSASFSLTPGCASIVSIVSCWP